MRRKMHGPESAVVLLLAGTLSPLYGIYSGYELCENVPVRPGSSPGRSRRGQGSPGF